MDLFGKDNASSEDVLGSSILNHEIHLEKAWPETLSANQSYMRSRVP